MTEKFHNEPTLALSYKQFGPKMRKNARFQTLKIHKKYKKEYFRNFFPSYDGTLLGLL